VKEESETAGWVFVSIDSILISGVIPEMEVAGVDMDGLLSSEE
jgi:hypothetical protein